jgi:hypothetical protein
MGTIGTLLTAALLCSCIADPGPESKATAREDLAEACAPTPALDPECADAGANYLVPGDGLARAAWTCTNGPFDWTGTTSACVVASIVGETMRLCCTP